MTTRDDLAALERAAEELERRAAHAETATVELLTAEVRVLMVGSRQVTLSVARQLDEVDPWDIEPFGRISMARKLGFGVERALEVIGSADGRLARSVVLLERAFCCHWDDWRPLSQWNAIAMRCAKHLEFEPAMNHVHKAWQDDDAAESWKALPLIVLAGLK